MHDSHSKSLKALERRGRLRTLLPQAGHDFSSNDYLGLAGSKLLASAMAEAISRGVPVGSGGSRLLRGNHPEHEALEAEAALFFGAETALFFAGGFSANHAIFATLPERGDLIVYDELIHASVHDGTGLSRAAHKSFRHNDPQAVEDAVRRWRADGGKGRVWIAVESLYSMDGDLAPIDELAAVADRHDAFLVIDEAHATGVLGENGRGLGAHLEGRENVIALHTCGKALGVMGAIISLPRVLRDYMVNRARAFIYATAPSPLIAATVRASLVLVQEPDRRRQLADLVDVAGDQLARACGITPTGTQIQPVIVGRDTRAVELARQMQQAGFDIRAVRPPTVPEGTSRLRISLTLNVTRDDVAAMATTLGTAMREAAA